MTAMSDALERAGYNKADMHFYAMCGIYFKSGGTFEKGVELLRKAAEKLGREVSDTHHRCAQSELSSKGQAIPDTQMVRADARQPVASEGARHALPARAEVVVPPARKLVPYAGVNKPRKKPKVRTEEQKQVARMATMVGSSVFKDRNMHKIRFHQLETEAILRARRATSLLKQGIEDTKDTVFMCLLASHTTPVDKTAFLPDVFSDKVARRLWNKANEATPTMLQQIIESSAQKVIAQAHMIAAE